MPSGSVCNGQTSRRSDSRSVGGASCVRSARRSCRLGTKPDAQPCQIARSRLCTQTRSSPPPPSASSTRATPRATGQEGIQKPFAREEENMASAPFPAEHQGLQRGFSDAAPLPGSATSSPSPRWSTQTMRRAARRRPRRPRRPPRRRRARPACDAEAAASRCRSRTRWPRRQTSATARRACSAADDDGTGWVLCGPMSCVKCVCVRDCMCERTSEVAMCVLFVSSKALILRLNATKRARTVRMAHKAHAPAGQLALPEASGGMLLNAGGRRANTRLPQGAIALSLSRGCFHHPPELRHRGVARARRPRRRSAGRARPKRDGSDSSCG